MNRKLPLAVSICVNLLLAVLVLWLGWQRPARNGSPRVSQTITQRLVRVRSETNVLPVTVTRVNVPFHWRELEATDFRIYIENLRAIGCPELTIFDIVSADVSEMFNGRVKELVDGVSGRFWNLVVKPEDMEKLANEKAEELKALEKEHEEVLQALFGEQSPADKFAEENSVIERVVQDKKTFDFLSDEKLAKLREIGDRRVAAQGKLAGAGLLPEEHRRQFDALAAKQTQEIQAALTPDEYQEYRLRNEFANATRGQLAFFDGTESEVRAIALAKIDSRSDEAISLLLPPERFLAYQRSGDFDFQQTLRITERFNLPEETAAQIYQTQKEAEAQAKKIRDDQARAQDDRRVLLQAMQIETEKFIASRLDATQFKIYKKYNGGWLEGFSADVK